MAPFPLCLNTSTIRPTPLLEKVRIAGRVGYSAIELWNDEVTEHLEQGGTLRTLAQAIADAGLTVRSMIALHGWADAEEAAYPAVLEGCRRRMEQAAALGSPYIVASPPRDQVNLGQAARRFADLARLGEEIGARPAMEFLGFVAGIKTMASAWAIAAASGVAGARIVADVFHMLRGGHSVDDLLMVAGDDLAIFHINDVPAAPRPTEQTDHDRVMIGDGTADLPRVLAHLRTIGYQGPLSLELFNRGLWARDPEEVARLGFDRLQAIVSGA